MAVVKLEGIEPKNVTAVLLGSAWQTIVPESFTEETNGYTFTIPASEPGGEHKVFIPSPGLAGVKQ